MILLYTVLAVVAQVTAMAFLATAIWWLAGGSRTKVG